MSVQLASDAPRRVWPSLPDVAGGSLFEPCRPGLRRGPTPMRRGDDKPPGRLDRCVSGLLWRVTARHAAARTVTLFEMTRRRIDSLAALPVAARTDRLARLRSRLRAPGRQALDAQACTEALAHAVLAARLTLGLVARDGQCKAALELLHGRFVEMPTGEGKTLTVALVAAVVALGDTPVHVLTANDYLAERDARKLGPLYAALGLSVACTVPSMDEAARRAAYACDIVHVTGKQVAFDWLRDGTAAAAGRSALVSRLGTLTRPASGSRVTTAAAPMLRGLCFAIVDEADSLLVDEARTPLVLAAERAGTQALAAEPAIALGLARMLREGVDFDVSAARREVELTEQGKASLQQHAERVAGTWRASRYRDERVRQALAALHLFHRERDYIVRGGRLELVDDQTGRTLPDRRLQHGLHRLLESKEGCALTPDSDVIASVPFQRFLRRYVGLVGTSGTLGEIRGELAQVYGAPLVEVGPERPCRRRDLPTLVVSRRAEQLEALIADIRTCQETSRPVLIGTRSVEQSLGVAATLSAHGIPHRVLNARQDRQEAQIVAAAGAPGQVTVATNMAGRGTDIPLGEGVAERGGLHVVSLAFNDARRIDRQLAGRAARQGEPGTFRRIASLDDPDLGAAMPAAGLALVRFMLKSVDRGPTSVFERSMPFVQGVSTVLVSLAQRRVERRHARQRRLACDARDRLAHHVAIGGQLDQPS